MPELTKLKILVVFVGLCLSTGCSQESVKTLPAEQIQALLQLNLEPRAWRLPKQAAGFSWRGKKYLFVAYHDNYSETLSAPRCLEIDDSDVALPVKLAGEWLKIEGSSENHCVDIIDLDGDGVPEFRHYFAEDSATGAVRSHNWNIVNLAQSEIIEASINIYDRYYYDINIEIGDSAERHPKIKRYLLNEMAKILHGLQNPTTLKDRLRHHWFLHNGWPCSVLYDECQIDLLWLDFPDGESFPASIVDEHEDEHEDDQYRVVALFKGGVYLIDKHRQKIALIYLPCDIHAAVSKVNIISGLDAIRISQHQEYGDTRMLWYTITTQKLKASSKF